MASWFIWKLRIRDWIYTAIFVGVMLTISMAIVFVANAVERWWTR